MLNILAKTPIGERQMNKRLWTREEEIIVFNLYCKIPFRKSSKTNPEVIKIANIIGRTPSAVNMKVGNFGRLDPKLREKNIVGLSNGSKLDEEIWNEFHNNWGNLAFESEKLIARYSQGDVIEEEESGIPLGADKKVITKQRINQSFFRKSVLASYNNSCCITGLSNPEMLIASHIKPWKSSNENEKTNPANGLCLNGLHDRAFDKGFITIDKHYKIHISKEISDVVGGDAVDKYFMCYDKREIILPDKFLPDKEFLCYHNDMIFESWK